MDVPQTTLVVLGFAALWVVAGIALAMVIGRMARRGDEDARLFGSLVSVETRRRDAEVGEPPKRHDRAKPHAGDEGAR